MTEQTRAGRRRPSERQARDDGAQLAARQAHVKEALDNMALQLQEASRGHAEILARLDQQLRDHAAHHQAELARLDQAHQDAIATARANAEAMAREVKDHTARMIAEATAEIGKQVTTLVNSAKEGLS